VKNPNRVDDIMMPMDDAINMRTIVDLNRNQLDALADVCRRKHISRAEAIRRAVDALLQNELAPSPDLGFGAWEARKEDSVEIIEKLRSEWDRR
jgi:hypothetical protein